MKTTNQLWRFRSGLAAYFNIDVVVRIIFLIVIRRLGFITYIIMWIAVPSRSSEQIGGPVVNSTAISMIK